MGCQDEEWSFPGFHIVSQNDPQDEKTVSSIKHKSEIEYTVSPDDEEVQCPECGTECGMYGNRNPRRVQDLSKPDGARVYLTIESKRYICSACKKTRSHPAVHALVRGQSSLTNRLANRIKEESLLYTPEILEASPVFKEYAGSQGRAAPESSRVISRGVACPTSSPVGTKLRAHNFWPSGPKVNGATVETSVPLAQK